MKNPIKKSLLAVAISFSLAACGNNSNSGSSEANTSDSMLMDTPMTTETGSDTLQNTGGTEVDNTRNPSTPQQTPNP